MPTIPKPPFSKSNQLSSLPTPLTALAGYPQINLRDGSGARYLRREIDVTRLNELDKQLWIAGRKSHYRALHKQLLLGRKIRITEDPALHLVWYEDRIFIKPCPEALLSWDVWDQCICTGAVRDNDRDDDDDDEKDTDADAVKREPFYEAACGFLQSYTRLITHPSDYRVAVEHHLIPDMGFDRWCLLAGEVANTVSSPGFTLAPRWRYGELRLSRLNLIYKLTLRGYSFTYLYTSYGAYFNRNLGVLLLGFAYCSVVLAAMQVVVALQDRTDWLAVWCLRFSVATIFGVMTVALGMLALFLGIFISQFVQTLVHQRGMRMPAADA